MAYRYIKSVTEDGLTGIDMDESSKSNNRQYIDNKIEYFRNYEKYSNKNELLNLFKEINDRIEDDDNNATFDFGDLHNIIGNIDEAKHLSILSYHLGKTLGYIIFNVYAYGENRIKRLDDGFVGAISTRDILMHGINEFMNKTNEAISTRKRTHAYGANFIFVSIFEEELKLHIERYYSKKYLLELSQKINNGLVSLSEDEDKLFDYLCNRVEIDTERRYDTIFDTIYAVGKEQFDLLNKYTDISRESSISELYNGTITLNRLRNKDFFKNIVNEEFAKILNYLFATNHLNLRNNLAHSNLPYFDYHELGYTAILYLLVIMVSKNYFLKDGIN